MRVGLDYFFTVEWMHTLVEEGDIVIIEFGHFEGGGPIGSIRHNVLCPGLDPTVTCERCLAPNQTPDRMTLTNASNHLFPNSDDGEVFHTFFK